MRWSSMARYGRSLRLNRGCNRLRILNASNSRFFNLSLSNAQAFHQIGTDQGLMAEPVSLKSMLLAPAERVDLLIDFSGAAGQQCADARWNYGHAAVSCEWRCACSEQASRETSFV